ncbi:hypothetical protein DXG03_006365 [Asterophora parasitica]|uniref:3-oxo-5-alpha-steroid 4-dehydrogenase C-terminal domain-containing protein n=1 Tax=Asterophora parasitica TaxID=117018 RepID=A0A9P7K9D5_9AGAR|nr:hypothetical protein DXG03_006365 [Asterophora parasitica]
MDAATALGLYDGGRKYFTLMPFLIGPLLCIIDAPFGRFTPSTSLLLVDGIKSWIVMELVSPVSFLASFLSSPLSSMRNPSSPTQLLLAALYLIHYANRALISPLRTPSRSPSHISVPLAAVLFNTVNGSLMGTYLSSASHLQHAHWSPAFWAGVALWVAGFVGNVWHDEVLLDIRRKARAKADKSKDTDRAQGEHYAIPTGGLYAYVSYPNYLCEWAEWTGFALAASPFALGLGLSPKSILATLSLDSLITLLSPKSLLTLLSVSVSPIIRVVREPASAFAPGLTPPWIFLLSEVLLMLPRAIRGHQWYHQRFQGVYPPERRAVVPWVL